MKKIIPILSLVLLASCYNDKEDQLYPQPTGGCDTTNVTFATDIQAIGTNSCAFGGCHDAATKSSGYDLTTYAGFKLAVDNNRLLGSINRDNGFSAMPKGMNKLGDCEIAKITAWVNAGAPNN